MTERPSCTAARKMSEPPSDQVDEATAPARWLLVAGRDGVPLTQTYALARVVVREAAERWPGWWAAELFGPPHREADVPVLGDLHEGLRRLKLMRRRGRALYTTPRGRQLLAEPAALLQVLTADLGGGDAFTEMVAGAVVARLSGPPCGHDDLVAPALRRCAPGGALPRKRGRASRTTGPSRSSTPASAWSQRSETFPRERLPTSGRARRRSARSSPQAFRRAVR